MSQSPAAATGQLLNLGSRLRAIRASKNMTLADVARLTGLPVSTISKLENGKAVFTYDKMMQLKSALGIDLTELLSDDADPPAPQPMMGRRSITRAGEGLPVDSGSYRYLHVATDVLNKHFTPMIGTVTARSLEEFGPFIRHPGEEFVYVVSGVLELHTELYAPTILNVGDSMFFDSNMGHAYITGADAPCRMISVCWNG